jgi:mRNA interferase MazF
MILNQYDIVLVNLNPSFGSEQQGDLRPCVILQTNAANKYGNTILIAPCSTKINKIYPYEVLIIKDNKNNLLSDSKIKFDQIRVIDKRRIGKKIGLLNSQYIVKITEALSIIFDLPHDFLDTKTL